MYRSKAGGQDLEDEEGAVVDGDDDDTEINYRNNSHWKRAADCGLSNYVSYYDAASLYPSSGKNNNNNNKTLQQSGNIYHPQNPTQRPLPPPPHDKVPQCPSPLTLTRAASYARIPSLSLSLPPPPAGRRRRGEEEEEGGGGVGCCNVC